MSANPIDWIGSAWTAWVSAQGDWAYVIAAYGVTAALVGTAAGHTIWRYVRAARRAKQTP